MSKIYRFLSEDDTAAFCHKISDALAKGWELYGSTTQTFDPVQGVMHCGQAVTKDVEADYTPDMKLGAQ